MENRGKPQRHRESLVIFITVFDRLYVSGNNTEVTCYYSATRSQLSWFLIQFMICWEFQCFHSDVTLHSDICGWKWRNINFRAFVITNSTSYQKQFVLRVWGQAKIYVWLFLFVHNSLWHQDNEIWNQLWTNMWKD